jgi:Na+/H+-dicarboxylate symporter
VPRSRFLHSRLTRRLDVLVRNRLWLQVLIGLVAGALVGLALGPDIDLLDRADAELIGGWLALPGRLFLAAVGMVIVPLAASSIFLGIAGSGGGEALKSVAMRLGAFVVLTSTAAAGIGLVLARSINLGGERQIMGGPVAAPATGGAEADEVLSPLETMTRQLPDFITALIPQNLTVSLFEQDMLAIVVFSIFIAVAVVNADNRELTKPLVELSAAILEVCMTVIRTAMRFAPVAVFGLIAQTVAASGLATLQHLAIYCVVVLTGLLGLLILYVLIVSLLGRMSPLGFLRAVAPVQLLAFSTSSSAAVMPLTMKTAVEKLGASTATAGAVVPLAATVNMAGTALYQSVAIVFLAEMSGVDLAVGDLALIMVTLTGASIGAPAAPGASIAVLAATATSFGVPLAGLPLILGVDRLLDMARTVVNVTGDLVACRLLSLGDIASPPIVEIEPAGEGAPEG